MLPLTTILHPTDFSENSEFAFRLACSLARDYNARLILLHVVLPPVAVYDGGWAVPVDTEREMDEARQRLRHMETEAHRARVESLVMEGDPVGMILRAAEETHSDVIIMGTHGRGALARLLMGSVAEAVLRKAPCPVLTARPVAVGGTTPEASETTEKAGVAAAAHAE